ncbi:unnamed protein product [Rotaria sp. Silwood2]|nr:unnamed protein product [Rotaria sp. Silwood2]CAF2732193.1 unnamed protein product [Rotaria sp. Silwood2]CAF3146070.1 unnamed protein product [Rotaria sp. Silwood2]CAF4160672.1 unnamed protein product [Rotaria sp. Silwood2]CAF4395717.1 unnamed protein product [Rotaria sp. Silwood2]
MKNCILLFIILLINSFEFSILNRDQDRYFGKRLQRIIHELNEQDQGKFEKTITIRDKQEHTDLKFKYSNNYENEVDSIMIIDANLSWNFATNITEANEKILIAQSLIRAPFSELALPIAKLFNEHMKYSKNDDLRYIFGRLALGVNSNNTEDATAKVCEPNDSNKCYTLAPYLERLMQIEKDYDRLIWAWKGWHDGCGNQVHPVYLSYVDLLNKNVKENG